MKTGCLSGKLAAFVFFSAAASCLSAQTTTVESVIGQEGRTVPSASGILNPRVVQGRFGTSLQGGYFGPDMNRPERRFSSNALFDYSGEFLGMVGDADAARSEAARRGQAQEEDGLSEIDKLLILRHMRNRAQAMEEREEPLLQRSAEPYPSEPVAEPVAEMPPEPAGPDAAPPPAEPPGPAPPAQEPMRRPPSEQIWMRGSSRYTQASAPRPGEPSGAPAEGLMIDPRWFEFGADTAPVSETAPPSQAIPGEPAPAPRETAPPVPGESGEFEEGMVIGGRLPDQVSVPVPNNPSDALARNGRQERRQSAAAARQLETRLLQSPLVNPLAPIHVSLNGTTAVVTGVVGSEEARVEAGKVILQDGRVETVDNRIVVYGGQSVPESDNPGEPLNEPPAGEAAPEGSPPGDGSASQPAGENP